MKVKALKSNSWRQRNEYGKPLLNESFIEHQKGKIYEVTSKCIIGLFSPGYTIKIGNKYGAIHIKDCEIVESSLNDLQSNNNNLILVL